MSSIFYYLLAILLFGVMVLIHELGHFWAARLTGIGVSEFAVGIGPKVWSKVSQSGIRYSLRALPFGGYCRFVSEEDEDADRADAYFKQPVWKRAVVSIGGPLMNFVMAYVVIIILLTTGVFTQIQPVVDIVIPDMPAEAAGFLPGDRIIGINGVSVETTDAISGEIAKTIGSEIAFSIERDARQITLYATPKWMESESGYRIGINYRQVPIYYEFWDALSEGVLLTGTMSRLLLDAFIDMIGGKEDLSNLSGPVGTVVAIKEQTQQYGFAGYLNFAAFLSVNLAVFNLLPIPGLDGSRLVFLLIEKIRGKRIDPNKEGFVILLGFGLLMVVMVLALYQDIARLLS